MLQRWKHGPRRKSRKLLDAHTLEDQQQPHNGDGVHGTMDDIRQDLSQLGVIGNTTTMPGGMLGPVMGDNVTLGQNQSTPLNITEQIFGAYSTATNIMVACACITTPSNTTLG